MPSTPYAPPANPTHDVVVRLAHLRKQIAAWFWVEGLARVLWLTLAILAMDLAFDFAFRMDRPQRVVMFVLMISAVGWTVYRCLLRPLSAAVNDDALALQVEFANDRLGQSLITALQLARLADPKSRGMSPTLV